MAPTTAGDLLLEMEGITKRFPGVVANEAVDFDVRRGEVHTLLGENGAGKSTLMKILYGLYDADEGEIRISGKPATINSPSDAIDRGIGMIHQHFMLVPTLTVAENVALGLPPAKRFLQDLGPVRERIRELSDAYGLQVDPDAYIWQLAVGERQRVEIMKAIYRDVSLLILDEPTSVLTPAEVDDLFVTLRQMTDGGRGLVFISHKLHEVMALSDRITVLRGGRVTGRTVPSETSREQLAHMMVGREVQLAPTRLESNAAEARLEVKDLNVLGDRGTPAVTDFDLEVRSGEVVGIAGVSGNGQRELAEALAGLRPVVSGEVVMNGVETTDRTPKEIRRLGVSYIPEERMRDGAIGEFSVAENLILCDHDRPPISRRGLLDFGQIEEGCSDLVRRFTVKTPTLDTPTANLSGGNIQKLVIARELSGEPELLIASQPTRGVDIGAAEYIHTVLMDQRAGGTAILLISEDLDEVIGLSDRIAVMFEGRIMGTLDQEEATVQRLGLLMAGVSE
ncbi:ABC transporter ATP-binding protein [Candidatus Spongiisocius sp.]|uniref:ABC transporter ATP-binding protein n=1 Tax=Candidatus Spongiisocius sp. TaxID=3101273 RepID=UPI003B5B0FEA